MLFFACFQIFLQILPCRSSGGRDAEAALCKCVKVFYLGEMLWLNVSKSGIII